MIVMSWFELVQTLIQTIPFGMDIVDEKGNILFQNDVFKDQFGEAAIGKKCWELYRDDKKQCINCPLHKGIKIGETKSYISYGVLGDRIFDIHHTGMMFNGKKAMLEIFQDITERKHIEDELKKSEEQFRQLFGNMEQGFSINEMIFDENGKPVDYRFLMINKSFETLTGLKGVDIIGRTAKEVIPNIEPVWIENYGKVAKTGKAMQFESYMEFVGKWYNVTAYCPKKGNFAMIFYDSTKYKKGE